MATRYRYECIADSPKENHVHFTQLKKGETYAIAKTNDPEWCAVTGRLFSSAGGSQMVTDKHLLVSEVKPYVRRIS
jgi:hypothetical protein